MIGATLSDTPTAHTHTHAHDTIARDKPTYGVLRIVVGYNAMSCSRAYTRAVHRERTVLRSGEFNAESDTNFLHIHAFSLSHTQTSLRRMRNSTQLLVEQDAERQL